MRYFLVIRDAGYADLPKNNNINGDYLQHFVLNDCKQSFFIKIKMLIICEQIIDMKTEINYD
jgi:hypothetical protein